MDKTLYMCGGASVLVKKCKNQFSKQKPSEKSTTRSKLWVTIWLEQQSAGV
jgi:hypothetical protein